MMKAHKANKEFFVDESSVSCIEPNMDSYLTIFFKDGTYKKIDKITFE